MEPHPSIVVGTDIFILGFGNTAGVIHGLATSAKGIIANEVASHYAVMPPQTAEELKRRATRFFMVTIDSDYGVSGGPVFDKYGYLKGMVCKSYNINITWALKTEFMQEALTEVLVRWM